MAFRPNEDAKMKTTQRACTCGTLRLEMVGEPIIVSECHCNSCREAGERLGALPGAPRFMEDNGGTSFILCRKDRVKVTAGAETLKAFKLKPSSHTRRIVATCCNTPVFLEFKGGHWFSVYKSVWPADQSPATQLRTMTSDLPDPSVLDNTIPNGKRQSVAFFAKLFVAWAAMGFRSPDVVVNGEIEA